MLEPGCLEIGARPVLRGRRRSNAPPLPDWKPPFHLLEAEGFECWLLNAKHVKNVPGWPKTDRLDAVWLAKVVERGMCRPSLVHPKPIRQLRDVTRYRRSLVREQTREKQRLEKTLEDAQIKLDSVISDLHGVSGRQMLQAMIDGQRNPKVLAELAHGHDAPQDPPVTGGVDRPLRRPPRLHLRHHAAPHRRPARGHRRSWTTGSSRDDRPFRGGRGQAR